MRSAFAAATVTRWLTKTGCCPFGSTTSAETVPLCVVPVWFVTRPTTVSAAVDRSVASCWSTCTSVSPSAVEVCSWTGNWMPVFWSGGTCVQSTLSTVNMEVGSLGWTSRATALVPRCSSFVTSNRYCVYAPCTRWAVATSVPLTHASACPTTPLTTKSACRPAGGAVNVVRYHHGTANRLTVSGPIFSWVPKHWRIRSE